MVNLHLAQPIWSVNQEERKVNHILRPRGVKEFLADKALDHELDLNFVLSSRLISL